MTGSDLLKSMAATLDAAGIPFMLTGSMASAYYGAGRATMDIDLVIDPTRKQLLAVVASVTAAGLYVSAGAALEALDQRSMLNVVTRPPGGRRTSSSGGPARSVTLNSSGGFRSITRKGGCAWPAWRT